MNIKIDSEFKSLIPPLKPEEYSQLEANILADGIRDALVVWKEEGILVDGHNRYEIAQAYDLPFEVVEKSFSSRSEVIVWIIDNQAGRRNLADFVRYELLKRKGEELKLKGREKQKETLGAYKHNLSVLSENDKTDTHNTREIIAEDLGWSTGKVAMADVIDKEAPEEIKDALRSGEISINKAYKEVKKAKKSKVVEDTRPQVLQIVRRYGVELGQWWELGKHRLFIGDSSTPAFFEKVPQSPFAFADPPYNANAAEWDNNFSWSHDWLISKSEIVSVTPGISSIFDFARTTSMPYKWSVSCWISNGMTRGAIGFGNWIYAAVFSNGSIHRNEQDFVKVSISVEPEKEENFKGRKPIGFVKKLISIFSEEGDFIIDPFGGSGTTLFAANELNRICYMAEIEPLHAENILTEWESITGIKPIKVL